jgi:hypothetical protein
MKPRHRRQAPLDPAILKLIDALARSIAAEDDALARAKSLPAARVEGDLVNHER